jgi:outer membrane receptor for ferrienterochelin and colicin
VVYALLAIILAPAAARGQITITLEGRVRGNDGRAVPSAQIAVVNPATNATRNALTDPQGEFRILGLYSGRYTVAVHALGYKPVTDTIQLVVGQRASLLFTLEPTAAQLAEVTVTGGAGATKSVEIQRMTVSTPVVKDEIQNLPTNARNVMSLAAVAPGIKNFAPAQGRALPSAGAVPDLRFLNMYLDGIELKSLFNGNLVGIPQTGSPLPQDAIEEFRVFLNPYDAEYSHAGAYVISAVSSRGTNEWHGSAFGFFQNKDLTARTAVQATVPDYSREQGGFSLRGPLQRDKLFLAATYEVANTNNYIDVVPARPSYNPGIWDQYAGTFKSPNLNHTGVLRLTYAANERNTFDATWSTRYMTGESNFGANVAHNGGITQKYFINVAQLRHQYLPTPNMMNELSIQFVRWHHDEGQLSQGTQFVYPSITLGTASFPLELNETHWRLVDRATYTTGNHVLKSGVEVSRISADQFSPNFQFGSFNFRADSSTEPFQGSIGVGFPNTTGTSDALASLSGWAVGAYVNDEWRVLPNLTVNLGLRYDADINTLDNDFTVPWASDTALNTKPQLAHFLNRGNRKNDLNNFSPRISFSWDPFNQNRTFLRGGFAIIYDRVPSFIGFQERLAASWRTYTFNDPGTTNPDELRQRVLAGGSTLPLSIILVKDKMNTPENHQFSVGIGHQFTDAIGINLDYIYQDVRNLYVRLNPNYVDATTGERALTPNYGDIILWDDFGRARLSALVASLTWQTPRVRANFAYTLGFYKADFDGVTAPAFPFRSSYSMQPISGDERHRFVVSEVAQLPYDFELSSIITIASPHPFNVTVGQDLNGDLFFGDDFPNGDRTMRPSNAWKNWYRTVDIRVGKQLFETRGTRVSATAEVFNLFNWDNIVSYNGRQFDATGNPIASFGAANNYYAARQGQLGVRVEF